MPKSEKTSTTGEKSGASPKVKKSSDIEPPKNSGTAIAIRLGQSRRRADPMQYPCDLGKVTCELCRIEYAIAADPSYADLRDRYAEYMRTLLILNHERGEEHPDSIQLPGITGL